MTEFYWSWMCNAWVEWFGLFQRVQLPNERESNMKQEYDFSDAERGALVPTPNKQRITIRLDADIIEHFKDQVKGGGNYQSLINQVLREHIDQHNEHLEELFRKVIREEIQAIKSA